MNLEALGKKKEFYVVASLAALVGAVLLARAIFAPFHARLSSLGREVALAEAALKKGIGLLSHREEIAREYEQYATYFSLRGLSDEEAVANFLREIERISRASGLTVLDVKPQKESQADKFSRQYLIHLKAEGHLRELVSFLYALHASPLLFGVEKLALSPKAEESPDLSITVMIAGVSFL